MKTILVTLLLLIASVALAGTPTVKVDTLQVGIGGKLTQTVIGARWTTHTTPDTITLTCPIRTLDLIPYGTSSDTLYVSIAKVTSQSIGAPQYPIAVRGDGSYHIEMPGAYITKIYVKTSSTNLNVWLSGF